MSSQPLRRVPARIGGSPQRLSRSPLRLRSFSPQRKLKPLFTVSQIPHKKQRYETVGDWIPGKPAQIRVSKMKDQRYVFLVALHEMIEYELCRKNGISDKKVVAFDVNFEAERRRKLHTIDAEPGSDPRSPYRNEHEFATMIEMMVAQKLGVKWSAYEKAILSLGPKPRRMVIRPLVRRRARA